MNISSVAKKTGLTPKAIRFYEQKGLVSPPARRENGYRSYNALHLEELTLLRQARQVGFTLEECRELVVLFNDPGRHSDDVKRRTLAKVREIEVHIAELNQMRQLSGRSGRRVPHHGQSRGLLAPAHTLWNQRIEPQRRAHSFLRGHKAAASVA